MYSRMDRATWSQILIPCNNQPAVCCENLVACASVAKKHLLSMQVREPFDEAWVSCVGAYADADAAAYGAA